MHYLHSWIWVLIPLAAISARTLRRWFRLKEVQLQTVSNHAVGQAASTGAETARLKERIAVLERIVTDRSTRLEDEIESLRDKPVK